MLRPTVLFLLLAITSAFAPVSINTQTRQSSFSLKLNAVAEEGRKAFLGKAAVATMVLLSSSSSAANAKPSSISTYDLDTADIIPTPIEKKTASGGGGGLAVGGVLFGGLALSLPFFLPNILRLLGVNSAIKKNPGD
mmetsp:Transcript_20355/g.29432  ORF Transcript_20355/g.29432 Transcript_20355/m.29432 type:complete len:137 (-) Transcript_20355:68-478(-)